MRYAITGATGFIGGALSRQLRDAGHEVVALVRDPGSGAAAGLAARGVELAAGDLDHAAALDAMLERADALFHVAGWYRVGATPEDAATAERVNVTGTRNVLAAAARAGTPRVVHTSTLAVNSDTGDAVRDEGYHHVGGHISVYDRTKARAHALAQAAFADGVPVVTVMPGGVYGPGDTSQVGELVAQVVRGGRPPVPRRGGTLVWAHVEDVAAGHLLAMEKGRPGAAYMLAGEPASLAELLGTVARIAGTKGPLTVPDAFLRATGMATGPLSRVARVPATYTPEALRVALASYLGTRARAERELGWQPRGLEEGLQETVAALTA